MIKLISLFTVMFSFSIFSLGCQGNTPKAINESKTKLTVGTVQKEIKKGMSQSDVASVLGSPNIVTKEEANKETWIYDRINSTINYEKSASYGTLILVGTNDEIGTVTSSQKTLTVIIKFNKGKVYDYKYHSSRF